MASQVTDRKEQPEVETPVPVIKGHGRIFQTMKHVGPFAGTPPRLGSRGEVMVKGIPHVFSEAEFRRLHPIPEKAIKNGQIDPATYHEALLDRLLKIGDIELASSSEPMVTPVGPENKGNETGFKNYGIAESTNAILANREARKLQDSEQLASAKPA